MRLLGGVLPPGGAAARDAQGRRRAADPPEGEAVHEGGARAHRRGGLRDVHARGGEPVLPAGELPLPARLAVHYVEQGDQGLAGDAGRRRGDHDGDPGPPAALVPRAEHPGSELSASGPGRRPEWPVVSGGEIGYVPGLRSLGSEPSWRPWRSHPRRRRRESRERDWGSEKALVTGANPSIAFSGPFVQ